MLDGNPDAPGWRNNPFAEDFFLVPYAEEFAERAARMRSDNRDAVRHFVELLAWEAMDNPKLKEAAIRLLWNFEDVDVSWIAEAFFVDVRRVCESAEAEPVRNFYCLICGEDLRTRSRKHLFRLDRSLKAICEGNDGEGLVDLLCRPCGQQLAAHADEQDRLKRLMRQALLADHRRLPYPERRQTREWKVLRARMLARAAHRCQLCGTQGGQLNVHHNRYDNYGEERLEDLVVLCRPCHERFHFRDQAS